MDGLRRSALALSALSRADRDWLLGNLPQAVRSRIEPLLGELTQLGLRPELDACDRLRDEECRRLAKDLAGDDSLAESAILQLDGAAPAAVAQLLAHEPDVVVAALLARYPWRWASTVRASLPSARRSSVDRLLPAVRTMRDEPWRVLVWQAANSVALAPDGRLTVGVA